MEKNFKEFYEKYWEFRENIGKIHTVKDGHIPERLKVAVSMIPHEEGGLKVLDVGCGEGTLGMLLKEKFNDIYTVGCDLSDKAVKMARPFYDKVAQVNIDEDDLEESIEDKDFDYIVCVEVIEHLFNPGTALNKCKALLSEKGCLIVSFPNIAWWQYRLQLLMGHFPEESRLYHHAEHLHDFTLHSFKKLLEEAGLECADIDGEFSPPRFMQRLKPKRLVDRFIRRYPNLFGYQLVIKVRPG